MSDRPKEHSHETWVPSLENWDCGLNISPTQVYVIRCDLHICRSLCDIMGDCHENRHYCIIRRLKLRALSIRELHVTVYMYIHVIIHDCAHMCKEFIDL